VGGYLVGWLVGGWEVGSVGYTEFLFVVNVCMPVVLKQWASNGELIDSDLFLTVNSIIGMLQIKLQTAPYALCFQRQTLLCQRKPHWCCNSLLKQNCFDVTGTESKPHFGLCERSLNNKLHSAVWQTGYRRRSKPHHGQTSAAFCPPWNSHPRPAVLWTCCEANAPYPRHVRVLPAVVGKHLRFYVRILFFFLPAAFGSVL